MSTMSGGECNESPLGNVAVPPEYIEECRREFESGGAEGCRKFLEKKDEEWQTIPLDITVIGNSGVGKSSFINSIRGLNAEHPESATVSVTECSGVRGEGIRSYEHPDNPMLKFWDLPGVGTPKFPKDEYLKKIHRPIEEYDFFLLLSSSRFTENDAWLGKEITELGRKYFYVRTKVADAISSHKKAYPSTHNENAELDKIRKNIEEELKENGCENTPVFLIDNYETGMFDFGQLQQQLIGDFKKDKKEALILSMCAHSKEMVQAKAEELRGRIWRAATTSAAVATVPIPGVSIAFDASVALVQTKFYFKQLGLDDDSLKRYAAITRTDFCALKNIVTRNLGLTVLTIESLKILLDLIPKSLFIGATMLLEEFSRTIPLIGSLIAAPLSFCGTYIMLKGVLDLLEKVALEVVNYAKNHGK